MDTLMGNSYVFHAPVVASVMYQQKAQKLEFQAHKQPIIWIACDLNTIVHTCIIWESLCK